ncbi:cytochrome P450 [Amycolatopsis vastitatis]|uniref:Cytochrome P450 n=1 Tax=Amycolatopsis vastitatis TaxID=1905142 RepID=A0A229SLC2_9PSEU|nr:cytochrome P450 [Amycolatopsis vastitatis]OXM59755.1 cytochrome P450 [Amycolatopsis vastitatis]
MTNTDNVTIETASAELPSFPMRRTNPLDPPPQYARLRDGEPVSKVRLPDGSVSWVVTRYDDMRTVLTDQRFSADSRKPGFPILMPHRHLMQDVRMMNRLDLPEHTAFRRIFVKPFTSGSISVMRPDIQRFVDELIDDMLRQGPPVDLVQAFSLPAPAKVICQMLGVPYDDAGFLQRFSKVLTNRTTNLDDVQQALDTLFSYVDEALRRQEKSPTDGLLGKLVADNAVTKALSHEELVSTVVVLLVDGYETTANMITLGTVALFQNPDQLAALRADPSLGAPATEELLRYLSISDIGVARVAVEDVQLGDVTIRAGEGVMTLVAAANHDEAAFPGGAGLDINRHQRPHLTFGHGIHQCLGKHLVTLELEVVYSTLFRRIPTLRLDVATEDIPFKHDAGLYGVWELPVTW